MSTKINNNGQHLHTEQTAEELIQQAHNKTKEKATNNNQKNHTNNTNKTLDESVQQNFSNAIVKQQEELKEASQTANSIRIQTGIKAADIEFQTIKNAKDVRLLQLMTKDKLTTAIQLSTGYEQLAQFQDSNGVQEAADLLSKMQNESDAAELKQKAESKLAELGNLGELPNHFCLG